MSKQFSSSVIEKPPDLPFVKEKRFAKVKVLSKTKIDILMEAKKNEILTLKKEEESETMLDIEKIYKVAERVYSEILFLRKHLKKVLQAGLPSQAIRERTAWLERVLMDFLTSEDKVESSSSSTPSTPPSQTPAIQFNAKPLLTQESSFISALEEVENTNILREQQTKKSSDLPFEEYPYFWVPNAPVMLGLNPGSYHMLGLAESLNYVPKINVTNDKLPWRLRRRASEYDEIHKPAINSLYEKMKSMHDDLYDAAMSSIDPSYMKTKLKMSMLAAKVSTVDHLGENIFNIGQNEEGIKKRSKQTVRTQYVPQPLPPVMCLRPSKVDYTVILPPDSSPYTHRPCTLAAEEPAVRFIRQPNFYDKAKSDNSRSLPTLAIVDQVNNNNNNNLPTGSIGSRPLSQSNKRFTYTPKTMSLWNEIKPHSDPLRHPGLKWERVKDIIHNNLTSERYEERKDAVKSLASLKFLDPLVLDTLKKTMKFDNEIEIRFEATKALITLECWDDDLLENCLFYLQTASADVNRLNILQTIKNNHFVSSQKNEKESLFESELMTLSCHDNEDIQYSALHCLAKFNNQNPQVENKLIDFLVQNQEKRSRCDLLVETCGVLVTKFHCQHHAVIQSLLFLLCKSYDWKQRLFAAKMLARFDKKTAINYDGFVSTLETRLWEEVVIEARKEIARTVVTLDLLETICTAAEKKLADRDEKKRGEAVVTLGSLSIRNERIIRTFLDMLDLDKSDYVRLLIIRGFVDIGSTDKRIMKSLSEKERSESLLANEARKALQALRKGTTTTAR